MDKEHTHTKCIHIAILITMRYYHVILLQKRSENCFQQPCWTIILSLTGSIILNTSEMNSAYLKTPKKTPHMPYSVKSIKVLMFNLVTGGHLRFMQIRQDSQIYKGGKPS